jgi:hypothetical protein
MFRIFAVACQLGLSVPLIFRSHPTIPVTDLFEMFEWPDSVIFSRGRSLGEDLSEAWCVAYSSSTVVLEGMRRARVPLFVDIGDILSGDPLDAVVSCRLKVTTPADLLREVKSLLNDQGRLAAMGDAAYDYAQRYLVEPTVERISAMTFWLEHA